MRITINVNADQNGERLFETKLKAGMDDDDDRCFIVYIWANMMIMMMILMMIMMDRFEQYLWPSAGSGKKTSVLLPLIKTFGLFYFIAGVYQLINIVLVLLNPQVSSFDILWFW